MKCLTDLLVTLSVQGRTTSINNCADKASVTSTQPTTMVLLTNSALSGPYDWSVEVSSDSHGDIDSTISLRAEPVAHRYDELEGREGSVP